MSRLVMSGLVLLAWVAVQGGADAAEKRVALVIGNSSYRHAPELKNPRNDAADVAAALERLGFKLVRGLDLDKTGMERTIRDFAGALSGADVGVLFYAGHGLQVAGTNYLVPVDAQLTTAAALDFEMVRLDLVQRTMEREASANVLFLDACRDNPLTRNLARAMGTRSGAIGRGLAAAESGVGTLISFSTQPGNVALDGDGRNSPFAGALVKALTSPGEDLSYMLIGVRNDVMAATGNRQVPWEHSALRARFYFAPPQAAAAAPTQVPSVPLALPTRQEPAQAKPREPSPAVALAKPPPAATAVSDCPDDFRAVVGTTDPLACTCSAEATGRGTVRGMDVYTAGSSVCRAALHAGVITKKGGAVTVIPEAGRDSYAGLTRNGVTSYNSDASKGSFRFRDLPAVSDCPDAFDAFADTTERLACTCSAESTQGGTVRGMDVYTGGSSVCRAALHAGVITRKGGPVTVIPEAGRNVYAGVTRNGITSYNSDASKGSFRFRDLPAVSDCPDDFDAFADTTERLACTCSAESIQGGGTVRGMDVYTAGSSVCRAALHAGVITKKGGPVTVIPEAARNAYAGLTRNGITSYNSDASKGSFRFRDPPAVSDCPDDFDAFADTTERLACTCSAESIQGGGTVRGMDVYTAGSSVCRAALHAGVITKKGGPVTVIPEAARNAYAGLTRNGITSYNSDASKGSFRFRDPPAVSDCPDDFQAFADTTERLACTCSAEATKRGGTVRGMDVYTAGSSVCHAALHAGVLDKNGGAVTVIPEAGRNSYAGVTRNGVTSYNSDASKGSFRFAPD